MNRRGFLKAAAIGVVAPLVPLKAARGIEPGSGRLRLNDGVKIDTSRPDGEIVVLRGRGTVVSGKGNILLSTPSHDLENGILILVAWKGTLREVGRGY